MSEQWTTTGGPVEPSAAFRVAAKELRGIYLSLVAEGFSEQQALVIVGQILAANARGSQ